MAYNVNQTSIGLRGSYDELVYVVEDTDNTSELKYRYACSVIVDNASKAILRQLPNNADCAVFNTRVIAAQYVQQDSDKWFLGTGNGNVLSTNTKAFKTISMRFGYQYATSAALQPVITLLQETTQEVQLISGNFTLPTSTIIETTDSASYIPDDSSALFLSDMPLYAGAYTNYVLYETGKYNWATLAFINTDSSLATHIKVQYFNGTTSLTSTEIINDNTTGGVPPSTVTADTERLLYFGCGSANWISQQGTQINPAVNDNIGWTHYDITLLDSAGGNAVSATYRFIRLECNKFQKANEFVTLHWWNSKGGLDSLVFSAKQELTQTMQRTSFKEIGGNSFDANGDGVLYNKYSDEGGTTQSNIKTTTTYALNTAFGNPEVLSPLMMSLLNSERVYMTGSDNYGTNSTGSDKDKAVRIMIKDGEFMQKSSVNDGLSSYGIKAEISRQRPTR